MSVRKYNDICYECEYSNFSLHFRTYCSGNLQQQCTAASIVCTVPIRSCFIINIININSSLNGTPEPLYPALPSPRLALHRRGAPPARMNTFEGKQTLVLSGWVRLRFVSPT